MTTQHNHPMVFGRREANCPRCAELAAGAEPIRWHKRESDDARRSREIAAHFASAEHRAGKCGPICTFGDY